MSKSYSNILMKKIIAVALVAFATFSCQKEVEFNNPAFQGSMNNVFWKAENILATKTSTGHVTLKGQGQGDLIIDLASTALGKYELGTTNTNNKAQFTQKTTSGQSIYTTNPVKGSVNKVSLLNAGTGYTNSISSATSGGSGSGLKVNVTVNASGSVASVEIGAPGVDYMPGDVLTIVGGNQNAKLLVVNGTKSNGEVTITESLNGTITGNYKFIGYDAVNDKTITCREGIFYKVPLQ